MNLITLNDWLKRGLGAVGWTEREIHKACHSPCLTLREFNEPVTEEDVEAIGLMDDSGTMRTPFPLFRYWLEQNENVLFGCAKRERDGVFIFSFHREPQGIGKACWSGKYAGNPFGGKACFSRNRAFDTSDFSDITKAYMYVSSHKELDVAVQIKNALQGQNEIDRSATISLLKEEVSKREENIDALRTDLSLIKGVVQPRATSLEGLIPKDAPPEIAWLAVHGVIMRACYEYLAPYNFMASVQPDRPGKSIEWLQAREHYVVIHRRHPANDANCRPGAKIDMAVGETVSRLSHSRRAHTRLLRSEKFTHKRGQRIFIRATWIGPKEWRDTAGGIYRIASREEPAVIPIPSEAAA